MNHDMLMCRECGEFVPAVERDEVPIPVPEACPECEGTEFKDIHTETVVRSDDS